MRTQEELKKERMTIVADVADGFGLPATKGEIVMYDTSIGIEFGDVVVTITPPKSAEMEKIKSFAQAIASFPELFAQFGIDMADANEDFDKILLILKILADLFSKRTGADSADVNIATSDGSEDVEILPF